MNWADELQGWGVMLLLAGGFYVFAGYLFRSLHPTGMLNWKGRRWRKGGALLVLLNAAVFDIRAQFVRGHIGLVAATLLWAVVGVLTSLLIRWWWQDSRKEKAAQEELVEKLRRQGRELTAPPMSKGKRVWRWLVNAYAVFLVAAGLYALVRYLLGKF